MDYRNEYSIRQLWIKINAMSELDVVKETIAYMKFWLGVGAITLSAFFCLSALNI